MFFKFHLLIISVLIIIMYVIWQNMLNVAQFEAAQPIRLRESPFAIQISKASWGLNCLEKKDAAKQPKSRATSQQNAMTPVDDDPFLNSSTELKNKVFENNVLETVKALCDGKINCRFKADTTVLGPDPAPSCSKQLRIEYRCFDVDRPWFLNSFGQPVFINCDRNANEPQ